MDKQTIAAYDQASAQYVQRWRDQPVPQDLYDLLDQYFSKRGPTVDVGCGAGSEVAWLAANGFDDVRGVDASEGLLRQARALHAGLQFTHAALPGLERLQKGAYQNVLCETVLMHLDPQEIGASMRALLRLLRPEGTLCLSWRVTPGASQRDPAGRLYAAFDKQLLVNALEDDNMVLYDQEGVAASSGKPVHRLVVRKAGPGSGQ